MQMRSRAMLAAHVRYLKAAACLTRVLYVSRFGKVQDY